MSRLTSTPARRRLARSTRASLDAAPDPLRVIRVLVRLLQFRIQEAQRPSVAPVPASGKDHFVSLWPPPLSGAPGGSAGPRPPANAPSTSLLRSLRSPDDVVVSPRAELAPEPTATAKAAGPDPAAGPVRGGRCHRLVNSMSAAFSPSYVTSGPKLGLRAVGRGCWVVHAAWSQRLTGPTQTDRTPSRRSGRRGSCRPTAEGTRVAARCGWARLRLADRSWARRRSRLSSFSGRRIGSRDCFGGRAGGRGSDMFDPEACEPVDEGDDRA